MAMKNGENITSFCASQCGQILSNYVSSNCGSKKQVAEFFKFAQEVVKLARDGKLH